MIRSVSYHVFEISKKGRLKYPMHRRQYDYDDSRLFYSFASQEDAELAIEDVIQSEVTEIENMQRDGFNLSGGNVQKSYFILPQVTIEHTYPMAYKQPKKPKKVK